MKKNITSTDVARLAGVSQSTVSRVFSQEAGVSPRTIKKVLKAAKELDYRPNAIARGLTTNQTKLIGIIFHDVSNPFYPDVLDCFTRSLRAKGYQVLFVNAESDQIRDEEVYQLMDYRVEGVVVADAYLSTNIATRFESVGIPVVLFNRYEEYHANSIVCCNNKFAGYQIGKYLIDNGHKSFVYIAGKDDTSTSLDRYNGFSKALEEAGFTPRQLVGHYTFQGGYESVMELAKSGNLPDAIFCANDIMALGAIDAFRELDIKIPEDISIVGFDDIKMASWPAYNLTTWRQPIEEMVDQAIKLLIRDNHESAGPEFHMISGNLVERKSVKKSI
mgnify:CR=1 FL=1|jgi:DNA-binding LacI/PurR family transcriptional regulator